jgi:hypothetical protein
MTVKTNIGVSVAVALGVPATYTAAGYGAMTFEPCGHITSIGEIGGSAAVSSYDPMDTGIMQKLPGVIDYGSTSLEMAHDVDDAGQADLAAGFDGANKGLEHSFSFTDSTGDVVWFTSRIFSRTKNYGATGDIISSSVDIEINSTLTTSD